MNQFNEEYSIIASENTAVILDFVLWGLFQ